MFRNFFSLFRSPNDRDFALDVIKTFISAFGLIATVFAGLGLFLSYQDAQKDRELAQERLVTDLFSKGVEQIGKNKDITVRIGGIYALERIAKDSDKDHWTIMEILTAYVRENSSLTSELRKYSKNEQERGMSERVQRRQKLEKLPKVSTDIQSALTVIGRREDPNSEKNEIIDLTFTNLSGADLEEADLVEADLEGANLGEAQLKRANLSGAKLWGANLKKAYLKETNLRQAKLWGADLSEADLGGANLSNADLRLTNFKKAYLRGNLRGATLFKSNLTGADLRGVDLRDADLWKANLSGANLSEANLVGTDLTGANLSKTKLSNHLSEEQKKQCAVYQPIIIN